MRPTCLLDYPAVLKDWCLWDQPDSKPVRTRRSVTTTRKGVEAIADPVAFFASRTTIGEHLDVLVNSSLPMNRCVLVTHAPPFGLGRGVLQSAQDANSPAARAFVRKNQPPLLTPTDQIHESQHVGAAWSGVSLHTTTCEQTTCHQPGQAFPYRLSMSIGEIDDAVGTTQVAAR